MSNNDDTNVGRADFAPDLGVPQFPTSASPAPMGRLHPEAEAVLQATPAVRAQVIIKDRMIRYPALAAVEAQADWLFKEVRRKRARGLVVSARAGNGKSSLAEAISRRFKPTEDHGNPCALMISMSGARDARTVYGRIMEELGSPARISHRLSDREMLVTRLLKIVKCRLLILDEVQDLLLGSERDQQRALEAIKFLMNELRLPVLAFGTEKAVQGFSSDAHLKARFAEVDLPLWKADDTLANFLATYERFLPLKKFSNLASPDKVAVLAKVGGGVLDTIIQRIQNAALMAIADGSEQITKSLLERAATRPAICLLGKPHGSA